MAWSSLFVQETRSGLMEGVSRAPGLMEGHQERHEGEYCMNMKGKRRGDQSAAPGMQLFPKTRA